MPILSLERPAMQKYTSLLRINLPHYPTSLLCPMLCCRGQSPLFREGVVSIWSEGVGGAEAPMRLNFEFMTGDRGCEGR